MKHGESRTGTHHAGIQRFGGAPTLFLALLLALGLGLLTGCGGDDKPSDTPGDKPADKPEKDPADKPEKDPDDKPAEEEADSGFQEWDTNSPEIQAVLKSTEFPADLPFNPDEWKTATGYPLIGSPKAQKNLPDRPFKMVWPSFPPTLRPEGRTSNLVQTRTIHNGPLFEMLIQTHPETEETIPWLASHWKIENAPDGKSQVFTYRLDPDARFSDGSPVTARDVYASFWSKVQEDRKSPSERMTFMEGFYMPEILDRLTIRVRTRKLNWRLFYYFGGLRIYKADEITLPGDEFLENWNWKFMTGSGNFTMTDLKKGESLTITQRDDWWGKDKEWSKHQWNFHKIKFIVIRNKELEYQKLMAKELDYYLVGKAQRWVEEIRKEKPVENAWVKIRRIYNKAPAGTAGIAFNMRKPPFNDIRVRKAFTHLFNRERLMEKLFFNQYEYINSTYPARDWGNREENEPFIYDPELAAQLLAEAGYKTRNKDGYLVGPDGEIFEVTMRYSVPGWERIWLVVKESYEDAGIKFNLQLLDYSTLVRKIEDRQFTIHYQGWGGLLFPNPETSWRSDLADKKNNNNITGFKNKRVDELCQIYNRTLERAEQKKIIREIDSIVWAQVPYAYGWYGPYERIAFWDYFGHPDNYIFKIGQWPRDAMLRTWWWDPAKIERTNKLYDETQPNPEGQGQIDHKPWD